MNNRSIIVCIMKDYTIQLDTGINIRIKNEKRIGYFCNNENDEEYFYCIIFDWDEKKQKYDEGGTCYMSKQEFNETVKSFREVF